MRLASLFLLLGIIASCQTANVKIPSYDVVVYGGTSAGVIAAYSAQKMGKSVLIIEPQKHLGGMSASGLGETDIGNKYAVTGLSRDFYRRLGKIYGKFEAWRFEPSKAEAVFNQYIAESGAAVKLNFRVVSVNKNGAKITGIELESCDGTEKNFSVQGKMFIDASYEGDLLALAGVSFTIGREDNSQYGETLNGVQFHGGNQIPDGIDPYKIEGDTTSGLLWGISPYPVAKEGTGDTLVQAYCYRLCLTNTPENRIAFTRPEGYDSTRYEVLRRIIKQRADAGWTQRLEQLYLRVMPMPNGKTDVNNKGGFSLDYVGASHNYAKVDYATRKKIENEHVNYTKGLLYFLSTDPAVPQHLRDQVNQWGWPKDEFTDNGNFPWQLYVREARRMVSDYVMTQANCEHTTTVSDGIAMGAYNMDSHNCQRVTVTGNGKKMVKNEGDIQQSGVKPYPIAYRSVVPLQSECENLLVPVCMSATHIAYGSIRMEPVFMVMGQSVGVAAAMAINAGVPVQKIDIAQLQNRLSADPLLNGTPADLLADDEDVATVKLSGTGWKTDTLSTAMYKTGISYAPTAEGTFAEYRINPAADGVYKLYLFGGGLSKNIPGQVTQNLIFEFANENKPVTGRMNMTGLTDEWAEIGEYRLQKNIPISVKIRPEHPKGDSLFVADALLAIPVH